MKSANHKYLTNEEKLSRLKRARQILAGGYKQEMAERRTHTNMKYLRQWAAEFGFELELERKLKA